MHRLILAVAIYTYPKTHFNSTWHEAYCFWFWAQLTWMGSVYANENNITFWLNKEGLDWIEWLQCLIACVASKSKAIFRLAMDWDAIRAHTFMLRNYIYFSGLHFMAGSTPSLPCVPRRRLTQSNRVSDFHDCVCSLFPKAILFYFYFSEILYCFNIVTVSIDVLYVWTSKKLHTMSAVIQMGVVTVFLPFNPVTHGSLLPSICVLYVSSAAPNVDTLDKLLAMRFIVPCFKRIKVCRINEEFNKQTRLIFQCR